MYKKCPENHYPYVIQPGDTFYLISKRLEVPLARIIAENPGVNPYYLIIGQVICIPACPSNHLAYIIQQGDTLYKIAKRVGVTIESIIEANPSIDPYYLRVAQRICIPKKL